MLVIVTGTETVDRKYIARQLSVAFNSFDKHQVEGYTVDYTSDLFYEVFDASNTLVYKPHTTNELRLKQDEPEGWRTLDETGHSIWETIESFRGNINNLIENSNTVDYDDTTESLQQMCATHNSYPYEYHVIYGNIGTSSIERLRSMLGAEKVLVLNVTRNPITSYVADITWERGLFQNNSSLQIAQLGNRLIDSMVQSMVLLTKDYATTVKYEDILANKSFDFAGKTISCPDFELYNDYLTQYENINVIPHLSSEKVSDVSKLNNLCLDIRAYDPSAPAGFPNNFFTPFGYQTLDFQTITQPK